MNFLIFNLNDLGCSLSYSILGVSMKIQQSEAAKNLSVKTSNKSRNKRFILLISCLLVSILIGYFSERKIRINAAQNLVDNCSLDNNCVQIIAALETLIQAKKSLRELNFANTDLAHGNFANADFYRTNFTNTNLANVNFKNANLYRADLSNANLANANLANANLMNVNLKSAKNLTPTQIKSACNWETAFYKGRFDRDYEDWIIDKQANQQFIQQIQQDSESELEKPVNCSKWKHWSQDR